MLYQGYHKIGLEYGPSYRTLLHAWGSGAASASQLRTRASWQGTQVHPADLDGALQLSALNAAPADGKIRLSFAVDEACLRGARGLLWTVRSSRHQARCASC